MKEFQVNLMEEHAGLYKRTEMLKEFIHTGYYFDRFSEEDRTDLKEQLIYMKGYLKILNRRITRQ